MGPPQSADLSVDMDFAAAQRVAIDCLPKYSTGCNWQGNINDKLQPKAPSPSQGRSSSLRKRQDTTTQDTEASSSSSEQLYKRPSLSWLARLPRPELGSVPYGEVITTCNEPGTVALTFDDGPWEYTEELLNILSDYDAEATFFVCGGNMGGDGQITDYGHPHLLRRMVDEGHQVGTHTWAHADLTTVDEYGILDQLLLNEQALVQALGRIPTYFRPPYFSTNDDVLDTVGDLGYHVISAGVDTNDWKGDYDAARQAFSQAVQQGAWDGSNGKIVLAHDIHERTVHELAAYMIEQARDAGFRLVTVGECMGDPEENWYRDPRTGGPWAFGSSDDSPLVKRHVVHPIKGFLPYPEPADKSNALVANSAHVKRDVVPPPFDGQDKESAETLRSYYPPTSTEGLHKKHLIPGFLPYPEPADKSNALVARAAEPSQSVAANVTQPGVVSVPLRMVPGAWPLSGVGSPSPKATFGLVLALANMFFLLH
ncbi:hypothetical protein INS49_003742 [Diaporthe citri]|uniref:uncharacterized protein n=1 Tax=Diaporthe citri TaxID=83186 RepID=UPI001C7E961B|nr:uncharacterized protein INS49_003742 [Diaporthe citri]KAG6355776.1 hypothetical protein INS49_003742 [Diaporthe citri]